MCVLIDLFLYLIFIGQIHLHNVHIMHACCWFNVLYDGQKNGMFIELKDFFYAKRHIFYGQYTRVSYKISIMYKTNTEWAKEAIYTVFSRQSVFNHSNNRNQWLYWPFTRQNSIIPSLHRYSADISEVRLILMLDLIAF